jgi:hypothetical protein
MKIKTERGYLMINEKEKEIKELAKEIVQIWNEKLEDEKEKEFKERTEQQNTKE